MEIRIAAPSDAHEILAIYKPFIENTAITFELDVPTSDEFRARIENTLKTYPYIVAVDNGAICGYAYASAFRSRKAYIHTAETSIYVRPDYQGRGIGLALYAELEKYLRMQSVNMAYACITSSEIPDEQLPEGSVAFHENAGYRYVGGFTKCGYKFDKWYGIVWMEKELLPRDGAPGEFVPFKELNI